MEDYFAQSWLHASSPIHLLLDIPTGRFNRHKTTVVAAPLQKGEATDHTRGEE